MELDALLDAIGREAEAEIARIDAAADAEVESILRRAAIDAQRVGSEARASRDAQLRSEAERRRAAADLDSTRIERAALEDGRRVIEGELARLLASRRVRSDYRSLLGALLEEAAAVASPATVRVDPRDASLMAEVAASMHLDVEVRPGAETVGGLEVETQDGRVVVNTIEERLRNADPALSEALASHFERIIQGDVEPPSHRPDRSIDSPAASPATSPQVSPRTAGGAP